MADSPGTWFSALRDRTSWNVSPGNSGTWTLRSSPRMLGIPGSVDGLLDVQPLGVPPHATIRTHVRCGVQSGCGSAE